MKKRIFGVIFACLLVTQQVKPIAFALPAASAVAWEMGMAGFNLIQSHVMGVLAAALTKKAEESEKLIAMATKIRDAALRKLNDKTLTEAQRNMLKIQVKEEEDEITKQITLVHRIAGILHPVVGAGMTALSAYGSLTAFAGFFGFGLPSAGGLASGFISYMTGAGGGS